MLYRKEVLARSMARAALHEPTDGHLDDGVSPGAGQTVFEFPIDPYDDPEEAMVSDNISVSEVEGDDVQPRGRTRSSERDGVEDERKPEGREETSEGTAAPKEVELTLVSDDNGRGKTRDEEEEKDI